MLKSWPTHQGEYDLSFMIIAATTCDNNRHLYWIDASFKRIVNWLKKPKTKVYTYPEKVKALENKKIHSKQPLRKGTKHIKTYKDHLDLLKNPRSD